MPFDVAGVWNLIIVEPMINSLVLLYVVFFGNFGLSIIAFTVLVRAAMIPLTLKQSRQMRAMSALMPKMRAIQERHAGDRSRTSQETMKLYKEQGVNPLGCLGPMVLQMPIFFGLFWALRGTLPSTPERLADLSDRLYPWLPWVHRAVPLDSGFITMDLSLYASDNPVPFNVLLPVLVGGSMWAMQKMTPTASTSRPAGADPAADAVDAADHVRLPDAQLRGRAGPLLDSVERCGYSDTGVRHRLGTARESGPEAGPVRTYDRRRGRAITGVRGGGDWA